MNASTLEAVRARYRLDGRIGFHAGRGREAGNRRLAGTHGRAPGAGTGGGAGWDTRRRT